MLALGDIPTEEQAHSAYHSFVQGLGLEDPPKETSKPTPAQPSAATTTPIAPPPTSAIQPVISATPVSTTITTTTTTTTPAGTISSAPVAPQPTDATSSPPRLPIDSAPGRSSSYPPVSIPTSTVIESAASWTFERPQDFTSNSISTFSTSTLINPLSNPLASTTNANPTFNPSVESNSSKELEIVEVCNTKCKTIAATVSITALLLSLLAAFLLIRHRRRRNGSWSNKINASFQRIQEQDQTHPPFVGLSTESRHSDTISISSNQQRSPLFTFIPPTPNTISRVSSRISRALSGSPKPTTDQSEIEYHGVADVYDGYTATTQDEKKNLAIGTTVTVSAGASRDASPARPSRGMNWSRR